MSTNLSIKNVPEALAEQLRERAKRNHRSLQGELLHILESATTYGVTLAEPSGLTVHQLREQVQGRGYVTDDDSTRWIREDRDAR